MTIIKTIYLINTIFYLALANIERLPSLFLTYLQNKKVLS